SLLGRGFLLLILGQLLLQGLFTGTGTGHRLIEARFRDANALFVLAALFLALLLLALLLGVGIRPFLALLPVLGVGLDGFLVLAVVLGAFSGRIEGGRIVARRQLVAPVEVFQIVVVL